MRHLALIVASAGLVACASAPARVVSGPPPAAIVVAASDVAPRWSPNGLADVRALAQGERAFVGILRMAPGARVPAHQDESEEYIYVLLGGGVMTLDGEEHTVRPGTLVFMPAGATVSFVNGPAETVALQVFADPASAAKYDRWTPTPPAGPE